ncbi:hypothetical protein [Methanoculleus sp.]|uniref:hypothetical protein n=1 Tax=Methanoculleus sp. TaxID=90427 RepID=UPI001BD340E9|nr:hypothetical protein [Methanoculleus sp.]
MKRAVDSPACSEFMKGCELYLENEKRNPMYKVANFWISNFWGKPTEMADGLGVLLLTWNQAFYRYSSFDFNELEKCIEENFPSIQSFRSRDIFSLSSEDETQISALFNRFLHALATERGSSPVAVAKGLHLLSPNFFPLWDKRIATAYGYNYAVDPAKKYFHFCLEMQKLALLLRECQKDDEKSLLKRIDEYNYTKYTLKLDLR